jgi:hypothetical protein
MINVLEIKIVNQIYVLINNVYIVHNKIIVIIKDIVLEMFKIKNNVNNIFINR